MVPGPAHLSGAGKGQLNGLLLYCLVTLSSICCGGQFTFYIA